MSLNVKLTCCALFCFLISCTKSEDIRNSTIMGQIEMMNPNDNCGGVEITLQNDSDAFDTRIVYSNQDGLFVFENVQPGFYYMTAKKTNHSCIFIQVGQNKPIHSNSIEKRIKVGSGEIMNVVVTMSSSKAKKEWTVLSLDGNPLDELVIEKGMSSVAFVLFNDMGSKKYFDLDCGCLFSSSPFEAFHLFSSIIPNSGELEQGENALIICYIEPNVYNSTLVYYDDLSISFTQELPIRLNFKWY